MKPSLTEFVVAIIERSRATIEYVFRTLKHSMGTNFSSVRRQRWLPKIAGESEPTTSSLRSSNSELGR